MELKLSSEERRNQILQEVITKNEVSINELAAHFGVTTETIRKDVSFLQDKNLLAKKHGSVTVPTSFLENEFSTKEKQEIDEKSKVAEYALDLIPEHAAIFLDASTTVLQLAKLLVMRKNLTIITNSLQINQVLANSDNQILLTGGLYRKKSSSYVGDWPLAAINQINVDYAFVGCNGFSKNGPTIHGYDELEMKKAIVARSKKCILLCDTSKLMNAGLYTFADYDALDMIIFERMLSVEEKQRFPEETFLFTKDG